MTTLMDLYQFTERRGINVDWFSMKFAESISMFLDGSFSIALDPQKITSTKDEYCKLCHEIGHCETGAFYNKYATCDIVEKRENKANRWAIENSLTANEIDAAVEEGYTDIWSLAEYFNVTSEFMRKAICYYTFGNLDDADYLPM